MESGVTKQRSLWRGWVVRGAVCLAVGVVVNVLVAWGIALWWCPYGGARYPEDDAVIRWGVAVPSDWPPPSSRFAEVATAKVWVVATGYLKESEQFQIEEVQSGFPMLSMSRVIPLCPPGYSMAFSVWSAGIAVDSRLATSSDWTSWGLPLLPLWPGFVVDTLLYGVCALGIHFIPDFVRRTTRKRRGCCTGCGYELVGLVKCPECGSEVAAMRRRG